MSKAKIYTRTGDEGQTSLIGGKRVSKCSLRLEAYGAVDELNSTLGVLISYLKLPEDVAFLENIQRMLFRIGAILASENTAEMPPLDEDCVKTLEQEIDRVEGVLPPLRSFILPNGGRAACWAHICRTVCRRAERRIISLNSEAQIDGVLLCYVNRLSDYLFILARKLNFLEDFEEKKL
jgi:cob(I)alamin adenosyltransferase